MPLHIDQIEFHITHTCNLHCDGCAHYSNYGIKGMLPFSEGKEWLAAWSGRVTPERFKILGGEPTLHPELVEYVHLVAEIWPRTCRTLTTNGHRLDRHPALPAALAKTNTALYLTVHSSDPAYLKETMVLARTWSILSRQHGFRFEAGDGRTHWYKSYLGRGEEMLPYRDGNPRSSWDVCISKRCSQLHNKRLWKCPCLAYLDTIKERFRLQEKPQWQPYLDYQGIGLDATDQELARFLSLEDEPYCGMCPKQLVEVPKVIG